MTADQAVLRLRQPTRLAQQLGRDRQLADVVHQPRDPKPLDAGLVEVQRLGDGDGKLGHAALMPGGVRIAYLGRGGERLDRLAECTRQAEIARLQFRLGFTEFLDVPLERGRVPLDVLEKLRLLKGDRQLIRELDRRLHGFVRRLVRGREAHVERSDQLAASAQRHHDVRLDARREKPLLYGRGFRQTSEVVDPAGLAGRELLDVTEERNR